MTEPPTHDLTDEQRAIVEEEERLFTAVRGAIEAAAERRRRGDRTTRKLLALREEMASAKEADLPALLAELHQTRAQAARARTDELPDLRVPYFAHMRLVGDEGSRDVLLGYRTFIDARNRITIVDWREAPIAQIFFHYREGDEYEEEYPGKLASGTLAARRILTFDRGELSQIRTPEGVMQRELRGAWTREPPLALPELAGGEGGDPVRRIIGTGQAGRRLPVVSALLDPQQYDALTRDADRPSLILGGAGCGKTTVAVHRLAYLSYTAPKTYRPRDMLVVVPEEGLVHLTRMLLRELGMTAVTVTTVDRWLQQQCRALFKGLPDRLSSHTPATVIRFKRHPAFRAMLADWAAASARAMARRMDEILGTRGAFTGLFDDAPRTVPYDKLKWSLNRFRKGMSEPEKKAIWKVFRRQRRHFENVAEDRRRLYLERDLLLAAVDRSDCELDERMVDDVMGHAAVQFADRAEKQYEHVDADRLVALDGRALDDGTPTEDAGTIDAEDFSVLLELYRLKTGNMVTAHGRMRTYSHVVVDEAQDLAPIELGVIGQALSRPGSITVAGDPAQQIDVSLRFGGWKAVMAALGVGELDPVVLETTYRCTRPIARFAHEVLGPLAPAEPPRAAKEGVEVAVTLARNEMHAAVELAEAIEDLLHREPRAQLVVISQAPTTAERVHRVLARNVPARLALDGYFEFKPGVTITTVRQVKGLEFDYVIVPDASPNHYPDTPTARRQLHVAATRALHQLWVIGVGKMSSLVSTNA